jgi:hypothetical protein
VQPSGEGDGRSWRTFLGELHLGELVRAGHVEDGASSCGPGGTKRRKRTALKRMDDRSGRLQPGEPTCDVNVAACVGPPRDLACVRQRPRYARKDLVARKAYDFGRVDGRIEASGRECL